jgi:UMF1 family MFS transporter
VSLADKLALRRPEARAWALYDFALSTFQTTVMTAVFPIYFQKGLGGSAQSFTLTTTIAMAVAAVLGPILGALVDVRPWKKRLVFAGASVGAAMCLALGLPGPGGWLAGAIFFGLANVGASVAQVGYDALLPHVAPPDEVDRLSSAGYALGYVAGALALAVHVAILLNADALGLSGHAAAALVFASVGAWWMIFSRPLFRRVPEPPVEAAPGPHLVRSTFSRLGRTFRELGRYRQAMLLLVAFLVYNDGIGTIIRLATTFATDVGIPASAQLTAIIIVQLVGIPCTFALGLVARRIGAKVTILAGLVLYGVISALGYSMKTAGDFYLLAALVGLVQGGTQALSRSLFARLIPPARSGEFFGLFGVFEKFAGILGPLIAWLAITGTGSSRNGILAVVAFFAVGGALLLRVDVEAGEREARV